MKPVVDVVGQQLRIIPPHLFVILDGDVQIGAELAVGRGLNVHRLHQVMAALIQRKEKGLAVPNLHAQASGVHHVVGLYLTLTPDLCRHRLDGSPAFHGTLHSLP